MIALALLIFATGLPWSTESRFMDFKAFYCAGQALGEGGDSYHQALIARCEHQPSPAHLYATRYPELSIPAPFPPLTIAFFRIFALAPYAWAAVAWGAVLVAASIIIVRTLARMTRIDEVVIAATIALSVEYLSLHAGEIVPIAIAALVIAADAMARDKPIRAAVAVGVAALSPNLALPLMIALALWMPRARPWLALVLGMELLVDLAAGGPARTYEYLRDVLPAQAHVSALGSTQFGTTAIFAELGIPVATSVTLGSIWFVVMIAIGIVVGRNLARRTRRRELLVLIPVAFSVIGGPHLHIYQIAAAIPAALVLYEALPDARRILAPTIALLAIPWINAPFFGRFFTGAAMICIAILAMRLFSLRPLIAAFFSYALALLLTEIAAHIQSTTIDGGVIAAAYDPEGLVRPSWGAFIDQTLDANTAILTWSRFPTWIALVGLVVAACAPPRRICAVREEPESLPIPR